MSEILTEYLVSIGFKENLPEYRKFEDLLKRASNAVEHHTTGMLSTLIKVQAGVFGAFTSVSGGILGLVDSIAQADQGYRLLGMRQMMTTDSARKLDMVTKALGVSLSDIIWDPELHARALSMFQDIDHWTKQLGPDFEKNMVGIRDIRMQFSRLKLELQFLGMGFASDLFQKLGIDGATIAKWVDHLGEKLPQLADELSSEAVPILRQTWLMLMAMGGAAKDFSVLFTNLVGLLTGDDAIMGADFSFRNLARAIQDAVKEMAELFQQITITEKAAIHFVDSVALLKKGDKSASATELKRGLNDVGASAGPKAASQPPAPWWERALGGAFLGAAAGIPGGPVGIGIGAGVGGLLGGTGVLLKAGDEFRGWIHQGAGSTATGDIQPLIAAMAEKNQIPPALALAVAKQESGFNQSLTSKAGAIGVMQLMPGTAHDLGVDPTNTEQNVEGGTRYLHQLLEHYRGNEEYAAAAYNHGEKNIDRAIREYGPDWLAHMPKETRDYVPSVMRMEKQYEMGQDNARSLAYMQQPPEVAQPSVSNNQRVTIDVGGVHIQHQNPNTSDITKGVAAGIRKGLQSQTQFDLGQLQAAY